MLLILALVFLASMVTCHILAVRQGRNPVFWGALGAIFGPVAIIAVLASNPETKK